jgi:hypothetical protein
LQICPHSRTRMALLSQIEFGAALQYSVRAVDAECRRKCFQLRDAIKRGHMPLFNGYADYLAGNPESDAGILQLLGNDVVLVPAPGSALRNPGSLWVPELICSALVAKGLAARVEPCLTRQVAVPKSATSPRDQRPTAQRHYETIGISAARIFPERFLVVDDVVTTGATLLAAVSRVADAYPNTEIRAFALTRAISGGDVPRTHEPVRGAIRLRRDGKTWRDP